MRVWSDFWSSACAFVGADSNQEILRFYVAMYVTAHIGVIQNEKTGMNLGVNNAPAYVKGLQAI